MSDPDPEHLILHLNNNDDEYRLVSEGNVLPVLRIRIRDPGSGSRSGMSNHAHISYNLETIFWGVKIIKFFDADPGSGMEKPRDGKKSGDPE
jgi:hypothetical protein